MRGKWAQRIAESVRPGGHLITLMFPLVIEHESVPPPYQLSVALYHELLDEHFELVYKYDDPRSPPKRKGKQHIAVWRRRT
jgi:hypothetical protein